MTAKLPKLTLNMTPELIALLHTARHAKERSDKAYADAKDNPKGGDGLSQKNVDWLMGYERAEKEAYAALGRYLYRAYRDLAPSQADLD